jgi:hypothetical protein
MSAFYNEVVNWVNGAQDQIYSGWMQARNYSLLIRGLPSAWDPGQTFDTVLGLYSIDLYYASLLDKLYGIAGSLLDDVLADGRLDGQFGGFLIFAAAAEAASVISINAALQSDLDELRSGPDFKLSSFRPYDTAEEAAIAVLTMLAPLTNKYGLELGGNISKREDGKWYYSLPEIGDSNSVGIPTDAIGYHTHPDGVFVFSNPVTQGGPKRGDAYWVEKSRKSLFLGTVREDGSIAIGSCDPGACKTIEPRGTQPSRIFQ